MDGDVVKGRGFFADADEEDGLPPAPAPAFDPLAVLRAIEAEDEDDGEAAPPAFDPASILRAIDTEDAAPEAAVETAEEDDADRAMRAMAAAFAYADGLPDEPVEGHAQAARDEAEDEAADDAREEDASEDGASEDGASEDGAEAWDMAPAAEDDTTADDWPETDEDLDVQAPEDDRHAGAAEAHEDEWEAPDAAPASRLLRMDELDAPGRKPRIALMGEFSAGKSTLSNLLIGARPLPMKVTATQLPPVWISWGDDPPYAEDIHGETYPIDIARLSEIDPAETRVIRIFEKSEILERCDIIDMPGISDPNMASEVWERVIGRADGVIWCTHATQAWRQSEASVWGSLDAKLFATSILLVTRFDKLLTETDRARVLRRVERETDGMFAARLPISLTRALAAGGDGDLLDRSGATDFLGRFHEILDGLGRDLRTDPGRARTERTLARDGFDTPAPRGAPAGIVPARILPRRVRPVSQPAPLPD